MPRFRAPGKPAYGAQLDPAHPLARALSRAWLFNEVGVPRELTTGVAGTIVGSATIVPTAEGLALAANGGSGDSLNTGFGGTNTPTGTIVWRVFPNFAPADGAIHQFWGHTALGGIPEFGAQKYSDNNWYVGWNTSGFDRRVTVAATTANLAQNAWQTYALAWAPGGSTFYRNGAVLGTSGSSLTVGDISAVPFAIGNRNDNGSINVNNGLPNGSRTAFTYLFNRALTAGEVAALTADPYALFAPKRRAFRAPAGAATYTGTAAITLPALTASGSGTHTAPVYTGTAAITLPPLTASGTGDHTAIGSAAIILPVLTAAGTGTHTAPVYTATGAATLPPLAASGSGTHTAPVYTGTGTVTLPPLTAAGTGAFTAPVYTGTAALTLPALTAAGTGIFATSVYSGSAALTLPALTASGSGTHTAPVYTGTAAILLPPIAAAGTGTQFAPGSTGSAAIALAPLTASGSGTFTVPTYTGTGAATLPALILSGSGTHTAPVFSASGAVSLPALTAAGVGAFAEHGFTTVLRPSGAWSRELVGTLSGGKRGEWS